MATEGDSPEVKQMKEALRRQLNQRYDTARDEFLRIEQIRKELDKMDTHFATDVNIIRNRIDEADRLVAVHERERDRRKKEYEAAEQALSARQEEKRKLTEHLSMIIAANDKQRKEKILELMKKLGMEGEVFEGFGAAEQPSTSESGAVLSVSEDQA